MIVFLVLFIGTGIALTAAGADMPFYQLSATVAIIPAIVLAILQGKDDLNKKIGVFLSGVGEINIITMCMIFLLAGGFASVASAIGGVTVSYTHLDVYKRQVAEHAAQGRMEQVRAGVVAGRVEAYGFGHGQHHFLIGKQGAPVHFDVMDGEVG